MNKKAISVYLKTLYDSCIQHFPDKEELFIYEYKLNMDKLEEMEISDFYEMLNDEINVLYELNEDGGFDTTLYCHIGIIDFIKRNIFN